MTRFVALRHISKMLNGVADLSRLSDDALSELLGSLLVTKFCREGERLGLDKSQIKELTKAIKKIIND